MSQNTVITNKDNRVVFVFSGIDLTLATNMVVVFGAETYQLSDAEVTIDSAAELSLDLSATAEVGKVFATVTYFDGSSVNGTDITSQELGNSDQIIVAIGTQLIIEDGSQVTNANSFVTDTEYKTYTSLKGLPVAANQPEREADLLTAMDYMLSKERGLQGARVSSVQALLFPRTGVSLYGYYLASDAIPNELKYAQMELAAQNNTSSILKAGTVSNLTGFSVDGVYSETYEKGGSRERVRADRANAFLAPLMIDTNALVRT